jgi:hypothetical protein
MAIARPVSLLMLTSSSIFLVTRFLKRARKARVQILRHSDLKPPRAAAAMVHVSSMREKRLSDSYENREKNTHLEDAWGECTEYFA